MRRRVTILLTALVAATVAVAGSGGAHADLHDQCWDHSGFRVGALVCNRIPPGLPEVPVVLD